MRERGKKISSHPRLILASSSPRRRQILQELGIPFESVRPSFEEDHDRSGKTATLAVELATSKVSGMKPHNALILGMDTLVALGSKKLGKPRSQAEAEWMLSALSNRSHRVITGVALKHGNRLVKGVETTKVYFRKIDQREITWYVKSGESLDKAGAYAIQGLGRIFVKRIEGCYFNVIGFPIFCFQKTLGKLGFTILDLILAGSYRRSRK